MSGWIIPIIVILIVVVSRVMKAVRQSQEKARREGQSPAATRAKSLSERLGFDTDFDTASPAQSKSPAQPTAFRIDSRSPWEFEQAKETPTFKEEMKVETPTQRSKRVDDEYRSLVDESTVTDEEAFKEETVAQTQPSPRSESPTVPAKHEPVRIAGIPLTPQTIRQGVIIAEILRRPEF